LVGANALKMNVLLLSHQLSQDERNCSSDFSFMNSSNDESLDLANFVVQDTKTKEKLKIGTFFPF